MSRQDLERFIIGQSVRHACLATTFDTLWAALREPAPGWTEQQLAEFQAEWSPIDLAADMGTALRFLAAGFAGECSAKPFRPDS
ncbi:MAG: hypothetical protein HY299_18945 [Verrucomicrobia bacterium]|nr:hypothetical protein [Verrucomicrobiota bacterium]